MALSIRKKLLLTALANLVFVTLVGLIGHGAVRLLAGAMNDIKNNGEIIKAQLQADQAHDALRADVMAAMLAGQQPEPAEQQHIRTETAEHIGLLRNLLAGIRTGAGKEQIAQAVARVQPDVDAYVQACAAIVPLAFSDLAAARAMLPEFQQRFTTLEKSMAGLSDLIEADSGLAKDSADGALLQANRNMLATGIVAAMVTLALGLVASRSIAGPLDVVIAFADRIAQGRLDEQLAANEHDQTETGRLKLALRNMSDSLRRIVGQVRMGSDAIAATSAQIATGNADLSGRTEQQADALRSTALSMASLTETVRHNESSAREASTLVQSAAGMADQGGAVVAQVATTMSTIDAASARIVDIIAVIESIAFQTNILALNAAVEAARAGEQGRGFAVVASEVRALAQRSAVAAGDIKTLIESSVATVHEGSRLAATAGETMQKVVTSVQQATAIVGGIATDSSAQVQGIAHINEVIGSIDTATRQNAELVQDAAQAAAALRAQTESLSQLVSVFRIGESNIGGLALRRFEPAAQQ